MAIYGAGHPFEKVKLEFKDELKSTKARVRELEDSLEKSHRPPMETAQALKELENEIRFAITLAVAKFCEKTGGPAPTKIEITMLPMHALGEPRPDYAVGHVRASME